MFSVVEPLQALGHGRCSANLIEVSSSLACDSQIPPAKCATGKILSEKLVANGFTVY